MALALLPGLHELARAAAPSMPSATTASAASQPEQVLDEVVVSGMRLYQMRENLIKAEDRFYALYNEINTDDDYDVSCTLEAETGTKLKKRVCRPVFFERAQEEEGVSALLQMQGNAMGSPPPASLVALERGEEFTTTMLKVINSDPRLRRLIREHDDLEKKFAAERTKRMKGKLILIE